MLVVTGLKSGLFATTEFNSLMHDWVVLYSLHKMAIPTSIPYEEVHSTPFYTNGDDNLISARLADKIPSFPQKLVEGFKDCGLTLTNGNKVENVEIEEIENVSYLKRKFRKVPLLDGGIGWFPQMDSSTIRSLIEWKTTNATTDGNFRDALTFARQAWDREMFRTNIS